MTFVPNEAEFVLQAGYGLTTFGRMEIALARLFKIAARCKNDKMAEKVFWSVNSLEVRTVMTNAALKLAFEKVDDGGALQAQWVDLVKAIPNRAKKRNELAHGSWVGLAWIDKRGRQRFDQFFAPYWGKASSTIEFREPAGEDPRPAKRFSLNDLKQIRQEFMELEMCLSSLGSHLRVWLEGLLEQGHVVVPPSRKDRPLASRTRPRRPQPKKQTPA